MCYSTTILSSNQMYHSDAIKEDDLDGTACPWVSKLKKRLMQRGKQDCFAKTEHCHISASRAAVRGLRFRQSMTKC